MPKSRDTSASPVLSGGGPEKQVELFPVTSKHSLSDSKKPKKKRRKRSSKGRFIDEISIAEVMAYSHLPSKLAAEQLGIGVTSLKRICRSHGIREWAYRGDGSSRPQSDPPSMKEPANFDGIPTATVLPYQEMVMEDQIAAASFELNLTDDQLEEMEDIILELITVSKSLRENLGFSVLNEFVMHTLLEKAAKRASEFL